MIASAFHATRTLLASTRRVLVKRRVITRGATLAWLKAPWTDRVALQAATSASLLGSRRLPIHLSIATASDVHAPIGAGRRVATAIVVAGEERDPVPLRASRALPDAALTWRLAHP